MFRDMKRYGRDPRVVTRTKPGTFNGPLRWREPAVVFTCSWSDFFIEDADVWRADAWDIIRQTPHLFYLILTKRPERILAGLPKDWGDGWDNVGLGVTVEKAENIGRAIKLVEVPAKLRFISYEPALEPVDFFPALQKYKISWIISGGESGPGCRPASPSWFRAARGDANLFRVPFFHKQNGGTKKTDGAWGGRELDGRVWHNFPLILKKFGKISSKGGDCERTLQQI